MSDIAYHNLDQVSVLGRALYVKGWARDFSPRLRLDGTDIPLLSERTERPDVAAFFDNPAASQWGFVLTGLLPTDHIDISRMSLSLSPDVVLDAPSRSSFALEDLPAIAMINDFIATVARTKGNLLEIGSRARSGNCYRHLFPADIDYVGLDVTPGPNVDVVGDAHEMASILKHQFDFCFSISVFEHLLMPWKVAIEMGKVLKPGGLCYVQSHSAFPLHDEPWDFWRYSKEAWRGLFNRHTGFEIVNAQYRYPAQIVPRYMDEPGREGISTCTNFLVSACVARKVGEPVVKWDAPTAAVYDMNYNHGLSV